MAGPEFSSWGTQQAADGDTEQQDSPEKLFHANKKLKKNCFSLRVLLNINAVLRGQKPAKDLLSLSLSFSDFLQI